MRNGDDDEFDEGNENEAEDGNAASDGQTEKDSDAIATLKLQQELEKRKALKSETDA